MWYVPDASKDAKLIYGLGKNCTEEEVRTAIEQGTLMNYLQQVPVKKDDLFFIKAGTIHAIGAGVLVAEIQESSNLTYRLYDYDRVGKDGEYYGTAEPPVRCGESHLSGLTEPPHFVY